MAVETLAEIEKGEAVVVEIPLKKDKLSGKKIMDLKIPEKAIIGGILRGEECLIPRGDTEVFKGDRLLIFAPWSEVERVEKYLR
jgi:trk system potassium uptake protein TrkA